MMCDQSPYSIEERLIASVWMHERVLNHQKIPEIRRNFEDRFGKVAPTPRVLREWEKKIFESGTVWDSTRCGRPGTSVEHIASVETSLLFQPLEQKTVQKRPANVHIPTDTLNKLIKTELENTNDENSDLSLCDQSIEQNNSKDDDTLS